MNTKIREKELRKHPLVTPGDLVWAHLDNPANQPIINVTLTFKEHYDPGNITQTIKQMPILNRVMIRGHWVPKPEAGKTEQTNEPLEIALNRTFKEPLNVKHSPYHLILGVNYALLRIHHGLGDGYSLVQAILAENPETQDRVRKRNQRKVNLLQTCKGLLEIIKHKPEGLGKAAGEKEARILGPWPLPELKAEARRRNLSLNDAFLRALERALERTGHPGVSAGATVELGGLGENRFGLILTKLTNLSPVQTGAHAAASMGLISLAGRLGERPAKFLVKLLSKRVDLLVSNVKGPEETVHLGGTPIESIAFLVPTVGEVPVGVTLLSYNQEVRVGLAVDKNADVTVTALAEALTRELDELTQK